MQGHSPTELRELKKKVDELEVLKTERIGQFIHATRMELVDYWDKCHYSQEERDKFDPFYADDFTEELLEKHETEVRYFCVADKSICLYLSQKEDVFIMAELFYRLRPSRHTSWRTRPCLPRLPEGRRSGGG